MRRTPLIPAALAALAAAALALPTPFASGAVRSPTVTAGTHFAAVRGARIAYRAFGAGPPLLLVTGLTGSMDAWDPALVDPIARHHRIVMLDNRGAGQSTGDVSRLTIHSMAEDALGLARKLRLRRPSVLGWSMGGFIAQDLAIHHPHALDRLVLCASAPPLPLFVPPAPGVLTAQPSLGASLAVLFPPDQQAAATGFVTRILLRGSFHLVSAATVAAQDRAIAGWLTAKGDDPRRVGARTLVADGVLDHLLPAANSRALARRIPHAQLALYPDAAHGFLSQYHAAFARRVLAFLAH